MTHADWVAEHAKTAPTALLARVATLFEANRGWDRFSVPDALLRAGEALLRSVVSRGGDVTRAAALDLLAADACVTWAFEAAASEPATVAARASYTMRNITEVAA